MQSLLLKSAFQNSIYYYYTHRQMVPKKFLCHQLVRINGKQNVCVHNILENNKCFVNN